jgi:hypothetical protein
MSTHMDYGIYTCSICGKKIDGRNGYVYWFLKNENFYFHGECAGELANKIAFDSIKLLKYDQRHIDINRAIPVF